jgi:hypothetical protein
MLISDPSHAHPGLYALQITCRAAHVPSTPQPAASGNPQTRPFGHSTSKAHGPPPASVVHDPTSHEHDPLAFVSHVKLGLPAPKSVGGYGLADRYTRGERMVSPAPRPPVLGGMHHQYGFPPAGPSPPQ